MKTIKELISESLTEVAATRDINRQNSISRVYKACPELKDIDDQILEVRNSRFIAVIDKDERLIKRFDIAEEELMTKRNKIIARNNIEPDFDELGMTEEPGIPCCTIEKEYALGSVGQLRTRFQAFVESLEIKQLGK